MPPPPSTSSSTTAGTGSSSTRSSTKRAGPPVEEREHASQRPRLDPEVQREDSHVSVAKRAILDCMVLHPVDVALTLQAYRPSPFDGLSDQAILICAEALTHRFPPEQAVRPVPLPEPEEDRTDELLSFDGEIAEAEEALQLLEGLRPSQQYTRSGEVS